MADAYYFRKGTIALAIVDFDCAVSCGACTSFCCSQATCRTKLQETALLRPAETCGYSVNPRESL